ncbi:ANTAR domain-containing protein [Streptomyces sp. NPDC001156]
MLEPPYAARSISRVGSACEGEDTSPSIATRRDSDRVLVTLSGGLRLEDSEMLESTLHSALDGPVQGVDLDLSGLEFWDWSALNVLLTVRRQALTKGKSIVVTAAGPVAERLLALTGTSDLLVPAREGADRAAGRSEPRAEDAADDGLRCEVVQLRRALQTRPEIDLARGILMATFGLSADEAWDVLVMASQNTNTKLHRLAADVVTTVNGTPLPDPLQKHLAAAVARITTVDNQQA